MEDLWRLERNWFEPPNKRRCGLSGICRKTWLDPATGEPAGYFVKFKENHCHRDWRHPIAGIPTSHREAGNLLLFRKHGLPSQKLVYFHQERRRGSVRAILATEELRGEDLIASIRRDGLDSAMIGKIAELIHRLHYHIGYEHRSVYAKHVWIQDGLPLLIDLEQARPLRWWRMGSNWKGVEVLVRHFEEKMRRPAV